MSRQYFNDLIAEPTLADIAPGAITTETALLTAALLAQYMPIGIGNAPGGPVAGKIYHAYLAGSCVYGTAGTLIVTPRYGTTTGGVTLGASATQNYTPSITGQWVIEAYLTCRTLGVAAGSGTWACSGFMVSTGTVATAGAYDGWNFGGTNATTCPDTVAGALVIGFTFSVSSTPTVRQAFLRTLN